MHDELSYKAGCPWTIWEHISWALQFLLGKGRGGTNLVRHLKIKFTITNNLQIVLIPLPLALLPRFVLYLVSFAAVGPASSLPACIYAVQDTAVDGCTAARAPSQASPHRRHHRHGRTAKASKCGHLSWSCWLPEDGLTSSSSSITSILISCVCVCVYQPNHLQIFGQWASEYATGVVLCTSSFCSQGYPR
jgi:hypothetical protein